jgi:hypothetical protein
MGAGGGLKKAQNCVTSFMDEPLTYFESVYYNLELPQQAILI